LEAARYIKKKTPRRGKEAKRHFFPKRGKLITEGERHIDLRGERKKGTKSEEASSCNEKKKGE